MRLLRITVVTLVLLVLLPLLAVQFFGGAIARQVVAAVNARLQTEIAVEAYDLSLLRSFPHLAVDLRGVSVAGSDGSALLNSDHLAFRLDLSSLFGKIRINGIVVEDGKLQLFTDVDGNTNYQLAGYTSVGDQDGGDAGAGSVEFAIDEARLRRVVLVYQDARLRTDALVTATDATFSGDFGARQYVLSTEADLIVGYLDQEGYRYLDGKELSVEARTTIDHVAGTYTLSPLRLFAGDLTVEATGSLSPTDAGLVTDLQLSSQSDNLEDVIALLPPAYAASLQELETRGDLLLSATVQGPWTVRKYPQLNGLLRLSDGRVESPRLDVDARDLQLEASFAYVNTPGGGVQTISVDELTGTVDGEPFRINLRLEDLADPRVTFRGDGYFPLALLPAFGDGTLVSEGAGALQMEGVTLSGRYADMIEPRRTGRVSTAGTIVVEDAAMVVNGREVAFPGGSLQLDNNTLIVSDLQLETGETRLRFSGRATNLVPVLFADSLNTRDAALEFTARLNSEQFNVNDLLALSGPEEAEAENAAPAAADSLGQRARERRTRITELLNGQFEATIEDWSWDLLEGEDFRGQLVFSPGQVAVRGVTNAMEGEFRIDATTDFGLLTHTRARVTASGVDAETFFYQNENFGQEFLTADNLSGSMNARLLLDLYYDDAGEIEYNRLRALAGVEILDGELQDFELLENFAFALKSGDLERVRFTRLANFIEIVDRTVYLPAMLIQSSAINLTLSGSHTFDQYLEYYIKVNAGQVIANKISRHDSQLEVLPARNGLFNLYYTIIGPLENYVVETDKSAVKDDFRRSEYRRERIRSALDEEFQTPIELQLTLEDTDQ